VREGAVGDDHASAEAREFDGRCRADPACPTRHDSDWIRGCHRRVWK